MKTHNKTLITFIEEVNKRNKAIEENKRLKRVNAEYLKGLNGMGIIVFNI